MLNPQDTITLEPDGPLRGEIRLPGDKSISHRAVLFSGLAVGEAHITGLSGGEDVERTLRAFEQMGVHWRRDAQGLTMEGVGLHGLQEPTDMVDCGNSGTTTRLLLGLLAGQSFFSAFTGDASLRSRPMARVATHLRTMGATILGRHQGDRLPMAMVGGHLKGGTFTLPVASAQIKSALMLAGLFADSEVVVTEPDPSRDHTERAFAAYGLPVRVEGTTVTTGRGSPYPARNIEVPGDISAAAFFLVGASIVPGSDLVIRGVGMNPTRTGVLEALLAMGAQIEMLKANDSGIEPMADLRVRASALRGTTISGRLIPRLIDEIPVLCVAAACASGRTLIADAAELRVKESDRIKAMVEQLGRAGIAVQEMPDGMIIDGPQVATGCPVFDSYGDHRIAMSMAILAQTFAGPSVIRGASSIATSFPHFMATLQQARGMA